MPRSCGKSTTPSSRASTRARPPDVARALAISFTDLARDPRVSRQLRALNRAHEVVAAGGGDPKLEGVRFVACPRVSRDLARKASDAALLLVGSYERYYWAL